MSIRVHSCSIRFRPMGRFTATADGNCITITFTGPVMPRHPMMQPVENEQWHEARNAILQFFDDRGTDAVHYSFKTDEINAETSYHARATVRTVPTSDELHAIVARLDRD